MSIVGKAAVLSLAAVLLIPSAASVQPRAEQEPMVVLVQQEDCYLLYAHCSQVAVKTGDTVKQGDKLGEAGSTGHTDNSIQLGVYRFPLEELSPVTDADGTVTGFTVNGEEPLIGTE